MIELDEQTQFSILAVCGEIDLANCGALDAAIAASQAQGVAIVSLERCTYLDSTTLTILVRRHKALDGRLVVIVPSESPLRRIFNITGLDELLLLASGRPEAIERAQALTASPDELRR